MRLKTPIATPLLCTTIDFKRFVPCNAHILISQKQHKKGLMP